MPQLLHHNAPFLRNASDSPPPAASSCQRPNGDSDFTAVTSSSSDGSSAASSCCVSDAEECDDQHDDHVVKATSCPMGGLMPMGRTKSVYSFNTSTPGGLQAQGRACSEDPTFRPFFPREPEQQQAPPPPDFPVDVQRFRQLHHVPGASRCEGDDDTPGAIAVRGAAFRDMLEPHLRRARLSREHSRQAFGPSHDLVTSKPPDASSTHSQYRTIADAVGVPYIALRQERAFLFDEHSYPLQHLLARALHVDDLTRLHELGVASDGIVASLVRDKDRIRAFHAAYDGFVTTFCVPLIHSLAITKNVFQSSSSDQITYRYQAFPTVQVVQPGDPASPPVCDTVLGHSIGCLHFCIPLTPSVGDNAALYVESHPGREDWHPLQTRAFGLGFMFDGARCLYFDLGGGHRDCTTVSLQFRVLLYREPRGRSGVTSMDLDDELCPLHVVEDLVSRTDATFYEEAVVDTGRNPNVSYAAHVDQLVMKKHGDRLLPVSLLVQPRPSVVVG